MTRHLFITALLLAASAALHASEPCEIIDRTLVFKHTSTDPKDPANHSGYNLGPSIALLPDGRLMAAWFSSPSEGVATHRAGVFIGSRPHLGRGDRLAGHRGQG
jgi:hypothetical protein